MVWKLRSHASRPRKARSNRVEVQKMLRARAGAARGLAVGARRALSTAAAPISSLRVPIYQLDSFASQTFRGNPAAVCPLDAWLPDETLMAIADENALSETAFFVRDGSGYHLRWFTPTLEVAMCGHGTLATAALILERMEPEAPEVAFSTLSGELIVRRSAEDASLLSLDFPQWPASAAVEPPSDLVAAIGAAPTACYPIPPCPVTKRWMHGAPFYLFEYDSEDAIKGLSPDCGRMILAEANVLATAKSDQQGVDFVSRFFGPCSGIPEDPATGSAHTTLAPFWASRLNKRRMEARQLSGRGGELTVELGPEGSGRVIISGRTAFYLEGSIFVPPERQ